MTSFQNIRLNKYSFFVCVSYVSSYIISGIMDENIWTKNTAAKMNELNTIPLGIWHSVFICVVTLRRNWVVTVTKIFFNWGLFKWTLKPHGPTYGETRLYIKFIIIFLVRDCCTRTFAKTTVTVAVLVSKSKLFVISPSGPFNSIDSKLSLFSKLKTLSFRFRPTVGSTSTTSSKLSFDSPATITCSNNLNIKSLFFTFDWNVQEPEKACRRASLLSSSLIK